MSPLFPLPYCAPGREGTGHDYVLNLVLSDLEGGVGWGRWQGRREEINVYLWLIHSAAWQKLIHYNASILQLKIKVILK